MNGERLSNDYQLSTNTWHHVGLTFDGSTGKAYHNGSEITSTSMNTTIPNNDYWTMGDQRGRDYEGNMDAVDLYKKALTQTEVENHYNTGDING